MTWDKNDWKAAVLIGIILVAGLLIGLYSLGFIPDKGNIEMKWESPSTTSAEPAPEIGVSRNHPIMFINKNMSD